MALEAVLGCRQMRGHDFSGGDVTVVARHAIVHIYARVGKYHVRKIDGVMAIRAILVVGIGWNVIRQFTNADTVVVTYIAAADSDVIKGAGGKCSRGMAVLAIFGGKRHVRIQGRARRQTGCGNTMAGIAAQQQYGRVGMIDAKGRGEKFGAMAGTAIRSGHQMGWYCSCLAWCVDAVGIVMTGLTGHYQRVYQGVIEDAVKAESDDAMTGTTIDGRIIDSRHYRMVRRWITGLIVQGSSMTGITAYAGHSGAAVVGVSAQKA